MPVKKDAAGNRSVEAEVDVPGTPEEVWNAIATGPAISAWFVPSELEGRAGGTTVSHFAVATITPGSRPSGLSQKHRGGPGTVATEWTVEAKSGGTCTVRVVHRWFASSDDWDDQFEATPMDGSPSSACSASTSRTFPGSTARLFSSWSRLLNLWLMHGESWLNPGPGECDRTTARGHTFGHASIRGRRRTNRAAGPFRVGGPAGPARAGLRSPLRLADGRDDIPVRAVLPLWRRCSERCKTRGANVANLA
jgi:hypothetical protein